MLSMGIYPLFLWPMFNSYLPIFNSYFDITRGFFLGRLSPKNSTGRSNFCVLCRWIARGPTKDCGRRLESGPPVRGGRVCPYPWRILMVLLYVVCHGSHQEIAHKNVSMNIPAPWIRHGLWILKILRLPSVLLVLSGRKIVLETLGQAVKTQISCGFIQPVTQSIEIPIICPIFHCKTPTKLKPNPLIQRRNSPFVRPQRSLGSRTELRNWLRNLRTSGAENVVSFWYDVVSYVTKMDQLINKPVKIQYFQGALEFWCWGESEIQRQALQTVGSWVMSQVGSTVQPPSHCKWCNY